MNEEKLAKEFHDFAVQAAKFSRRISDRNLYGERLAESNLDIARTIFGKWCIEIFVILYNIGPVGFEDLRRRLGGISPRVLSQKLKTMESERLVRRTLINSRPPGLERPYSSFSTFSTSTSSPHSIFLGS